MIAQQPTDPQQRKRFFDVGKAQAISATLFDANKPYPDQLHASWSRDSCLVAVTYSVNRRAGSIRFLRRGGDARYRELLARIPKESRARSLLVWEGTEAARRSPDDHFRCGAWLSPAKLRVMRVGWIELRGRVVVDAEKGYLGSESRFLLTEYHVTLGRGRASFEKVRELGDVGERDLDEVLKGFRE